MEETVGFPATKRIAVVTGGNKGIGLEICRQLASKGVKVFLTARDEKRGHEAVKSLHNSGLSEVVFHQLDTTDPQSIDSCANFIRTHFEGLDILVNNAAISGSITDAEVLPSLNLRSDDFSGVQLLNQISKQTYETAERCLRTNYYGTKQVTEAFIPLLRQSNSPRIVNVSSTMGQLKLLSNERAIEVLSQVDGPEEVTIDELINGFLVDAKEDLLEIKGWPINFSSYKLSKAALNAYTKILAKKLPTFCINAVSPGFVKTDLNANLGELSVEEGARGPVMLALMPDGGSSGLFFDQMEVSTF